jgi:putative hydrolase of HD superfamily
VTTAAEIDALLDTLRAAERLKDTLRSGYTAGGRQESVADHTWRVCLLADRFPHIDLARLLQMLVLHDLGEAVGGDIPAPEQQEGTGKAADERADFVSLIGRLPAAQQAHLVGLWDEYEDARTPEAKLAKALDKLETLLQHTQGDNPLDFDYAFNLTYGARYTSTDPLIATIRARIDLETERRAEEQT